MNSAGNAPSLAQRILLASAEEAKAQLDAAGMIMHPGERGRAREEALRRFVRRIVPNGFDVATGFVIDANGRQSRQQDLVIVRRDYHPVFKICATTFFPVEAVAAVIEVKLKLTHRTLGDALNNAASAKRLDRTGNGGNYLLVG